MSTPADQRNEPASKGPTPSRCRFLRVDVDLEEVSDLIRPYPFVKYDEHAIVRASEIHHLLGSLGRAASAIGQQRKRDQRKKASLQAQQGRGG
jgi:hypothetical protein